MYRLTVVVCLLAVAADAVLIGLGHGPDFVAWDIASRATLAGSNIYAHHPAGYLTGPFAYPPLFLYLELPFQYLAQHTGWSFAILGKLPIVAADFVVAWEIARGTKNPPTPNGRFAHGFGAASEDRAVAIAVAMYLLNPLVLYNSAFYGRFDSVCLAFFLLALRLHGGSARARAWFPAAYAAAIATKIFPAFVAPWFLWNEPKRRLKTFGVIVLALTMICLPFLVSSPRPFITDILLVNINQYARGLSWQVAFMGALPLQTVLAVSYGFLAVFLVVANTWVDSTLPRYVLRILLLFTLLSKVVYEQYLVWIVPFAILELDRRRAATTMLLAGLVIGGMISNPHVHPFGEEVVAINVALAFGIAAYLWTDR